MVSTSCGRATTQSRRCADGEDLWPSAKPQTGAGASSARDTGAPG